MLKKSKNYTHSLLRFCLSILFALTIFSNYYANNTTVDSLVHQLKATSNDSNRAYLMVQIGKQEVFSNTTKSFEYCDSALMIAQANNFKTIEAKAYDLSGILNTISGNYTEGIKHFKKAANIFKALNDNISLGKAYGNIATAYQYQEDFEKGLQYQLQSLKISEKEKDSLAMCISYLNLGNIQLKLENMDRAVTYFKASYLIGKGINQLEKQVEALSNLSLALSKVNQLDSANYYANLAIKIAEENELHFSMYKAIDCLGRVQLEDKKYQLAKQSFLSVKSEFEKSGYEFLIITNYYYLGETYLFLNNSDSASFYYHKALDIGVRNNYEIHIADIFKGLAKLHIKTHNEDSAIYYFDKYSEKKLIHLKKLKAKELEQLQVDYETTKKEEQILFLEQEAKLKDTLLEKRSYLIIILFLVIFILVIGSYFSYKYLKLNQEKKAGELENKALRAQMNPHFLFNSLNSIQRMYIEGKENEANEYMADFAELMRKVLDNSNYNQIPLKEELTILELYFSLEQLRCKNKFEYHIEIDEHIDLHTVMVPPLIFQPFVENAIWHGILPSQQQGKISISIQQQNNLLICTIKDNGIGFTPNNNKKHNSQGISITEKRIGNKINITSSPNNGTTINFILKLKT